MPISADPSTPISRRIPLPLIILGRGWTFFCAAYVLAATALDASFYAHFEQRYAYVTPLHRADLIDILRHFRIADLRLDWSLAFALLPLVTTLLLFVRPIRRHPLLYLCLVVPFIPIWGAAPVVLIQWVWHGLSIPSACTDGECLHEGWPLVESYALWGSVTMYIAIVAAVQIVRGIRVRVRTRRRLQTIVSVQAEGL